MTYDDSKLALPASPGLGAGICPGLLLLRSQRPSLVRRYLAAFVTDVADGWIARRFNQITRLGRILDPMADKLMTFIVILCLTADGVIPVWAVVIFFCKELAMAIGGYLMYRARGDVISSNWLGKSATGVFFVVCAALVLFPAIPRPWAVRMISAALVLTVAAFFSYLYQFVKGLEKRKSH